MLNSLRGRAGKGGRMRGEREVLTIKKEKTSRESRAEKEQQTPILPAMNIYVRMT